MKNKILIFLFIFFLGLSQKVNATLITTYFDYQTNSSLTEDNLDGNLNNIRNVVNGNLDNTNIASGYRLFELLGSVPAAGTSGRIVYDTTNNTLNFDTGSLWYKVVGYTGTPAQGDIIYHDGTSWQSLIVGTSGNILKTQGTGANPAWSTAILGNDNGVIITTTGAGANIDIGTYELQANTFESDVATGTAPFIVASTTKVDNLKSQYATDLAITNQVVGDILYFDGTNWVRLAKDTDTKKYLQAGTAPSWTQPSGFSNVIYCWLGSDAAAVNEYGWYSGTSNTPSMGTYTTTYNFFGNDTATVYTILTGRFVKIAGISTVTIHARLWAEATASGVEALLKVDIGGQNNTVKSVTSTTPTWVTTATIDVSSLTNGTTYDIAIQLSNETNNTSAYCSGVILTGS